ncbi:hypothetical protein HDU67_003477 [Dinochytrium kinnereticum]|nr:hypothetical protein HDU67_003477 [Dinochytrium kinnereticum]
MLRLADAMEARSEDLALAEAVTGKPIMDARADVSASVDCMRFFAGFCDKIHARSFSYGPNLRTYTLREPLGVCGLITSFNYPLLLATWKLAPSLAAGNTTILKPARQTPLSTLLLASLSATSTPKGSILPPGVLNVLPGGANVGEIIVKDPLVKKISFTGSTAAGRRVGVGAVESGPGLKRTALELGGKNAIIVCDDADVNAAVEHIIEASFSNAGQNCCAGSRILVDRSLYHDFTFRLKERMNLLRVGDPLQEDTQIGPLVDETAMLKVQEFIKSGVKDGLELLSKENSLDRQGYFVEPTAFQNVPDDHPIAKDEIFGPVVAILKPFDTLEEAICRANNTQYGLASGVMTRSVANAEQCISKLKCGFVWVNTYNFVPPFLPLGGVGESGYGKDCGFEAIDEFTSTKSVGC